ncbi:Methyltransferase domain-containing protein [Halobacillus alkaliphilus]|uniref:Methyltransferase domain-containing protein n=1 Tax=Halobacillus alkaliphilus TaxID=396056 RepID=A0A1I2PSM9_9BACI|nr:class I SAM-dependent methyltransferase [Halobacillus alkaliphilus]SFG19132.1 Methyltransferase domain-containing protein [Halobacillus alkaliphilus]
MLQEKSRAQNHTKPYSEQHIGTTHLHRQYRTDLRQLSEKDYNKFVTLNTVRDWSQLSWSNVGKPYEVEASAKERLEWEATNSRDMDPHTSWTLFNKSFHEWFIKDVPKEIGNSKHHFLKSLRTFKPAEVKQALGEVIQLQLWNYIHRVQDGIWDPRGKRALFEGLHLTRPRILFLGAAEGYEAMQLGAMYPGAEIVMVDYDEYCKTTRFKDFPDSYPFLGENPRTGHPAVYYKDDLNIEYVVEDIRNLDFNKEFDIVLSVGLLEHFPDEYKHEVADWHRRFLKPGGYAIMTTPRNQVRSRLYYRIMADVMNHTYRELMTVEQMGLYMYENGFDILRHGYIKVHNGLVCQPR